MLQKNWNKDLSFISDLMLATKWVGKKEPTITKKIVKNLSTDTDTCVPIPYVDKSKIQFLSLRAPSVDETIMYTEALPSTCVSMDDLDKEHKTLPKIPRRRHAHSAVFNCGNLSELLFDPVSEKEDAGFGNYDRGMFSRLYDDRSVATLASTIVAEGERIKENPSFECTFSTPWCGFSETDDVIDDDISRKALKGMKRKIPKRFRT